MIFANLVQGRALACYFARGDCDWSLAPTFVTNSILTSLQLSLGHQQNVKLISDFLQKFSGFFINLETREDGNSEISLHYL